MLRPILALAVVSISSSSMAAVLTGPVVNPANGNSYYLLDAATWTESQAEAVTIGGNLVTINDQAENDWVWSAFASNGSRSLWLGYTDIASEGNYVWVSGETPGFTNWQPGEPNNSSFFPGREDYGLMQRNLNGRWNDVNNTGSSTATTAPLHGVVEVAIPEPSSAALIALGSLVVAVRRFRP